MVDERTERLLALNRARHAWIKRVLARARELPFEPRPGGSDYNIHTVDIEADGDAEDEFADEAAKIMGWSDQS